MHRATRRAVLSATIVILSASSAVQAQGFFGRGGGGGFTRVYEPSVNSSQVDRYAEILDLDEGQAEAAKALFEAYQMEFTELAGPAREAFEAKREEIRQARDPSMWREIGEMREAWAERSNQLETVFLDDIKTLLTDDQAALWPQVERSRRREQTMDRGLMSGERVDVIELVDDLELSDEDRGAVNDLLTQYEIELDPALATRNEVYEEAQGSMRDMWRSGDMSAMEEMWDNGRKASVRVRDINKRYARQLEAMLPEGVRPEFADAVRERSFPMIYRPTRATRSIEAALQMEDLDVSQKEAITSINASFGQELGGINVKLERAVVDEEENMTPRQMMERRFQRGGDGEETDAEKLRRERRELDERTMERLTEILTSEQVERLPQEERRRGDGGRRGGDGEGRRGGGRGGAGRNTPREL